MNCSIERNSEGKIKKVLTPQGKESKLFNQLAKLPHIKSLEEALDIFKNVYTKKIGVYYQIIGKKGAQQLDEVEETTFRLENLILAEEIKTSGKTPLEIRLATGWEFNPLDLNWRYEINYANFIFDLNTLPEIPKDKTLSIPLSETIGEELLNAYPQFKNSFLKIRELDDTLTGLYLKEGDEYNIYINVNTIKDEAESKRTLRHEITHAIQDIEGFPNGANMVKNLERKLISLGRKPTRRERDRLTQEAREDYVRDAGEVEARNAETRAELSPEERVNQLLEETQDILFEGQIISEKQEPTLRFISDQNNEFNSFKEALKDSLGKDIEVGINIEQGFKSLATISSNTNKNELGGLINYLIKSNVLSDDRIIENGESFLQASGYDQAKQVINEIIIKEELKANVKDISVTTNKDGRIRVTEKEVYEIKSPQDKVLESISNAVKEAQPRAIGVAQPVLGEEALKERLTNFLNSIGVKTTSIEKYVENYSTKNGVEPTAEALADIANMVIAFKDGELDINLLSEETAHFIVEAWNEEEIEDILRNVHKTQNYLDHSQRYRDIYTRENKSMTVEEIEHLVRKEILGKELAEGLVSRFNVENKTEAQANILRKLYDLFLQFFENLTSQGNYKNQLEELSSKVEDLLISNDIEKYINSNQLKSKKFKLYNISTSSGTTAQKNLVKSLLEQEKSLRQVGRGTTETIQKLEAMLAQELEKKAVQDLIGLAKRQTKYIKEAITSANKKNTTLTNEENIVFKNLTDVIRPSLSQLNVILKKDSSYKNEVSDMSSMISQINDNEGMVLNVETKVLDKIIDRLMSRHNLEDGVITVKDKNGQNVEINVRQHLENSIKTATKDTNALYSYFGQITHASDPLLNLLGSVVGDMYTNSAQDFQKRAKDFQNELLKEGFTENDLAPLMQRDGYVVSEWDFAEFKEFLKYSKVEAYKENLKDIIQDVEERISKGEDLQKELEEHKSYEGLSNEELLKTFSTMPTISSEIIRQRVVNSAQNKVNQGSESVLSEEYLKKQEDKYKTLGINEITKIKLKGFASIRAEIKRNTSKSKSGVSIYTLQNKHDLEFLNVERRKASSPYNESGKLKKGLFITEYPLNSDSVMVRENEYLNLGDNPSEEATISYDMNKLTRDFLEEKNKETKSFNDKLDPQTHSKFYEDLEDMEFDSEVSREDIMNFFNLNTQVGFSKEFFENSDKTNMFEEFEEDENIQGDIEKYKKLLQERRAILNQYRDSNNGVNTLSESIPESIKKEILLKTDDIDDYASRIFMYIKGKNKNRAQELEQQERRATTGANESYFGAIEDLNLTTFEEKLKFTLEHMSSANRKRVEEYRNTVKDESGFIPEKMNYIVDNFGTEEAGVLKYAQSKLAPYYASYAPLDLQNFYDKVRNSDESMTELIRELNESPDVRISVSFDYLDSQDDTILNSNRIKDFKGGYQQPSLQKKPTVLGRSFDFENKNWSEVKKSKKLSKLHEMYVEFQEQTLQSLGEKGTHNVYLAPQVSKTRMEGFSRILKGNNTKQTINEWIQEAVNFRVDELAQGEEVDGRSLFNSGIRVIPKYYLNSLEEVTDVSTDLFYSSMLMAQQAELYRNRKEKYSEISALHDATLSKNRSYPEGKASEASNTYRMFKSQMDYALFGVQEVARLRVNLPILGQRDLTKTIKTIHRWKQNLSLALTPIIPATSMFTAHAQLFMERLVKQYVDPHSANLAMREFRKIGMSAVDEAFEVNSKSKLSVMGEYFGIYDLDNRFKDSQYGKVTRTLGKSMYILHTAGNFTPLSQGMLSTLYGNRVFAGKLVDFNQFKKIKQAENKSHSPRDIERSWEDLKPMYDYIKTESGTVEYDPQIYKDLNISQEEFRNLELGVISKNKALVEKIDGQIRPENRVWLQRNFLGNFVMTHKGWLSIATSNRFKGRHISLTTGQVEEGTYVSAGRYFKNVIEKFKTLNVKAFKHAYLNATETERLNMQRVAKEMGVLSALYALGILVSGYADEDDDAYLLQMTSYLFDRTVNETISAQTGIVAELYNSISSPIVGLQQVANASKVYELGSDDVITRGRYAGLTERERYLIRNIVGGKALYDVWDAKNLKSQRDSYKFFNDDNSYFNPISYILTEDTFSEE